MHARSVSPPRQVPLLCIDGLHLVQSQAIVRYLVRPPPCCITDMSRPLQARKHHLYGDDDKEAAQYDIGDANQLFIHMDLAGLTFWARRSATCAPTAPSTTPPCAPSTSPCLSATSASTLEARGDDALCVLGFLHLHPGYLFGAKLSYPDVTLLEVSVIQVLPSASDTRVSWPRPYWSRSRTRSRTIRCSQPGTPRCTCMTCFDRLHY